MPQFDNLDPDFTVAENLVVYGRYFGIPPARMKERIPALLDFAGLTGRADAKIMTLSGGMKRRLTLARALVNEPQVVFLDEPTTGLDPHVRQELWQRLEELRRTRRLTLLLSTHYMEEAERLCDRLVFIVRGRIIAEGSPRELIAQNAAPYVLEVRDAEGPARAAPGARSVERAGAHLYFAHAPEVLTPLMKLYEGRRTLLRRANLEDVFLDLVRDEDLAEELRAADA